MRVSPRATCPQVPLNKQGDTAARARRKCVISLCTCGALDTWSRGR